MMRACRLCGVEFEPRPQGRRGPRPVYCSERCQRQAKRKRQRRAAAVRSRPKADRIPWVSDRPCANCGGPIRSGKKSVKYCSAPDCKRRSSNEAAARRRKLSPPETHPCEWCGAPLTRLTTKFCGLPDCRRAASRIRMREYFKANGGNKHNTPERAKASYERRKAAGWKPWDLDSVKAANLRRKALARGAGAADRFAPREVFDRDGWRCGICKDSVDQALAWPDPLSPSLDHVVPLSLGGPHTRENTRLAHLICNVKRGNRMEADAA